MRPTARLALLAGVFACGTSTSTVTSSACVVLASPDTLEVTPGDTLALRGGPYSTVYDTVVRLGGVDADVLDVTRADCATCDVCRSDNDCDACGSCDACDDACSTCEESVSIEVPPVAPGARDLLLVNRYGSSTPSTVTVLAPPGDTEPPADTDSDVPVDTDTDLP